MSARIGPLRPWTTADVATLRRLAPTHTGEQVAAVLARSPRAVYAQASRLKIRLHKVGDASPLTKHPDELVRSVLLMTRLKVPRNVICEQHGIPANAVRSFVSGRRKAPGVAA